MIASLALLLEPFTDPILRASTLGCIFLSIAAALVGVFTLLRHQPLIGEVISHAAYPGVILTALTFATAIPEATYDTSFILLICIGGGITALCSISLVGFMERKLAISSDASLCFTLAIFFGIGVALVSQMQLSHPQWYRYLQTYLFGQTATLRDVHIFLYFSIAAAVIVFIILFYKELQIATFDISFAKFIGLQAKKLQILFCLLLVLAIVIGIHAVGVVLMSAMLIAPGVTARQLSDRLPAILWLSGLSGAISGYLGSLSSLLINNYLEELYPGERLSIPTGPAIVLVAMTLCLLALLLAPKKGIFPKQLSLFRFRLAIASRELLRFCQKPKNYASIRKGFSSSSVLLWFALKKLKNQKYLVKEEGTWQTTPSGERALQHGLLHKPL
jgi:manganese/zinc/iron transport system permease protein